MAGFRKAKAEQAALKVGVYGAQGSGKTFTTQLWAEGLAKITGKRVAVVDTERGTDFYCQAVASRSVHPEAFDFDAVYTRQITEVLEEVRELDSAKYGVIIIDSITHIWQACIGAYSGKETSAGTIPFHAWGKIKKPYKELMNLLLSSPLHVFICGRQGNEFEDDPDTGELKRVGYKMKAEGETPYEPHILFRMELLRDPKAKTAVVSAFAEKDRTGVLAGQTIIWPNFDNTIKPLLPLLGDKQAVIPSEEETGQQDAEKLAEQETSKNVESGLLKKKFLAKIGLAETKEALDAIGKELSTEMKKKFTTNDLAEVRERFIEAQSTTHKGK